MAPQPPTASSPNRSFEAAINQATNALRSLIYQQDSAPNSLPASGGYTNEIAATNDIDQLNGTTLNNVTVNGVSGLTAAEIPTDIVAANYLPLSGGVVTGDLDVTGTLQVPTLDASSTIFGGFIATNATTTNLVATNATSTNLYAASAVIPSLTATNATTSALAVTGTGYFAGNVGVGTTSPFTNFAVAGSGYFGNSLTVIGTTSVSNLVSQVANGCYTRIRRMTQ